MAQTLTQAELEAYLDEALPIDAMAAIEKVLRADAKLAQQLAAISCSAPGFAGGFFVWDGCLVIRAPGGAGG
jgi:hypothetical protein